MIASLMSFMLAAMGTPLSDCSGQYIYLPPPNAPSDRGVAFSVKVSDTVVDVQFADNGSVLGRKQVKGDKAVEFNEGRGDPMWRLECKGETAVLTIPATAWNQGRGFALVRSNVDFDRYRSQH